VKKIMIDDSEERARAKIASREKEKEKIVDEEIVG